MKKLITTMALAAALVPPLVGAGQAETAKLKFFTWGPPQNYLNVRFLKWVDDVNADAKGVLEVVNIPGLASGRTAYDVARNRVADLGLVLHGAVRGKFKKTDVASLPFLYDDAMEGSIALWTLYQKGVIADEYDEVNPMALWTFPPSAVHTKKPVVKLEDIAGMKLRIGGKYNGVTVKMLGGAGTYISYGQVYDAVSKGVVEGVTMAYSGIRGVRLTEILKHHTNVSLGASSAMLAMNPKSLAALPRAAREALSRHTGDALVRIAAEANVNEENLNLENARNDSDHKVHTLSADELARWKKAVAPAYGIFVESTPNGQVVLDAMRAEVAAYRNRR